MHELFSEAPYTRFMEFIAADADRRSVLCSLLEKSGLDFAELPLGKNRHIAVFPQGRQAAAAAFPATVFTAHYDRAEGSPGANDNSAAVFMLVDAALGFRRAAEGELSPVIFFTDKEELKTGETLEAQGAYALALYLKENNFDGKIFIFDACGTGDTLIVSTAADTLLRSADVGAAFRRHVQTLRARALEAARDAGIEKALLLPAPFSDDAGFFRAGLCAQTITVLPAEEAAAFSAMVRRQDAQFRAQNRGQSGAALALLSSAVPPPADRRLIPETWRNLNGPADSHIRLTTEHWKKVVAFAGALGQKGY